MIRKIGYAILIYALFSGTAVAQSVLLEMARFEHQEVLSAVDSASGSLVMGNVRYHFDPAVTKWFGPDGKLIENPLPSAFVGKRVGVRTDRGANGLNVSQVVVLP